MVFGALDASFWQARAMARRLGINLTEALADGRLKGQRYANLVAHCTMCQHLGECGKLLAGQAQAGCAEAPSYCRIKPDLDRMAAQADRAGGL